MSHLLSAATASSRFQPFTLNNTITTQQPPFLGFKGTSCFVEKHSCCLSVKPFCASQKRGTKIFCSMNMSAHQSDDHGKMKLDQLIDKVQKLWDISPEPVKKFPHNKALDNFIQLILDLILVVVKYLAVPVFAVTSLSEMSYCAHERKLVFVPLPVLFGVAVAGILKETALQLFPRLRDAEIPWHLIAIAIFFTLIKLPGPYYPYWVRIIIPHFANGVLLRTLLFAILWHRRPKALKILGSGWLTH
uniref:Embryo defective 1273 n=1 Tax=Glycine max TaxID=3847 RepID=C6TBN1_SOYBN|nr:unknown [Glycine max]